MEGLRAWFHANIEDFGTSRRARNLPKFAAALSEMNRLLDERAPASTLGKFVENLGAAGYTSRSNFSLRREYRFYNDHHGFGHLDFSRGINAIGDKKNWRDDALFMAVLYHASTKTWNTAVLTGSTFPPGRDVFPFPQATLATVSFTHRPDPLELMQSNPMLRHSLRRVAITREGQHITDTQLGECFLRRVVRGPSLYNTIFPHL